ncbi:enoyl-CoA hydratase-related protein [Gordonia paraffinivorans]|uniref:4-chlorobenzoyl coenzyme A dehalogenase-2 n=1 Tax=Gordonia paraffinivorans TaxID=175628 RepID=A0ABD7V186_9ACTN|nr:enoyl-CoA hydratase-related protein [Gordonia paraffinivorans]PWD44326.1 enoyl-CoA hydratase [Gordonia paraffinivorans]VFA83057.1 4-chlorobenzoyl coenzyme A dehalogenase-2 [Gordonia paraffinivorans]
MSDDQISQGAIRTSVDDRGVARLTICRPEKMNALDTEANYGIKAAMEEWSQRDDVRVIVLDGEGGSFSAGADVVSINRQSTANGASGLDAGQARGIISAGSELARAVRSAPVPVIASVDGPAAGIGASLALAADLIYATERSYFLLAFVNIGLMPDGGASMLFATAMGRVRANELALLGEKLRAPEALSAGLINGVYDDRAALDAAVDTAAGKLAGKSRAALRLTKSALDAHTMSGFEAAIERELEGQTELLQSPEFQAAIAAFAGAKK